MNRLTMILAIALHMTAYEVPDSVIIDAVRMANEFDGVYDLMCLWRDEEDPLEREAIVKDIQSLSKFCLMDSAIGGS